MFTPFKVKSVTIPNRVVMPPMCMYSRHGRRPDHRLASRALRFQGGGGSRLDHPGSHRRGKRGRLSGNDLGIWDDGHIRRPAPHRGGLPSPWVCSGYPDCPRRTQGLGRRAGGRPSALAFPGFAVPHALSREEIMKLWSTGVRLPGGPRPQVLMSCKFTGPMDT